jgi:hypothetical protein
MVQVTNFDPLEAAQARLQAQAERIAELEAALYPLASLYHSRLDNLDKTWPIYAHGEGEITVGDIKRARALLDE